MAGLLATPVSAQQTAVSAVPSAQISVSVNLNSKGISQVPALTLGRPAAVFDVVARSGRVSFEPQFRFATDGKPWSFLLWGRYRVVQGGKFRLTVGAHPAFSFRTSTVTSSGASHDVIEARRYLGAEALPVYTLTRRLSVGAYYLYGKGVDPGTPPHTHLLAARLSAASIPVPGGFLFQAAPQIYYLNTNREGGSYVSANLSLSRPNVPLSLTSTVNVPIRTDVTGGKSRLWNVGVTYSFP